MSQHDDAATLSDAALVNERTLLQEKLQTLRLHAKNVPGDHNLEAAINDAEARLSRISARIEFRLKQGAMV
jgi:hypothetical protein